MATAPKIFFVGRDRRLSQALASALEGAGYVVTRPTTRRRLSLSSRLGADIVAQESSAARAPRPPTGLGLGRGKVKQAVEGLSLLELLGGGGGRAGRQSRLVVFEAEPAKRRAAGSNTRNGTHHMPPVVPTTLRGLRQRVGKTQLEISREMPISQSQLSRLEGRHDHLVSTLRKYVKALGGEVEVMAVVDGARFVLRDV